MSKTKKIYLTFKENNFCECCFFFGGGGSGRAAKICWTRGIKCPNTAPYVARCFRLNEHVYCRSSWRRSPRVNRLTCPCCCSRPTEAVTGVRLPGRFLRPASHSVTCRTTCTASYCCFCPCACQPRSTHTARCSRSTLWPGHGCFLAWCGWRIIPSDCARSCWRPIWRWNRCSRGFSVCLIVLNCARVLVYSTLLPSVMFNLNFFS